MENQLKGAAIIGQSGGPTSVINASAYGVIRTALDDPNITKVYGAAHGIRGVLDDVLYDMGQEDAKELELLLHTPSSALGSVRYKLKDSDPDDFMIRTQKELSEILNTTTNLLTTLLACIAGISLLVGGIGIMNIMYVSVTERTREIGLRMSVGARGIDILVQFLIEAILISITGGILGILLGCGASAAVRWLGNWPVAIQPWSVILSFMVCTFTGVFFGWYPAKKAAALDPIDALRYE